MKKNLFLMFAVFALQLGLGQEIKEKALLWEISGNGLTQPSYLYGTMHIMCQGDVIMTPELEKVFNNTEELMLEMKMDDPSLATEIMRASMSKDGIKASEKMGEELAGKISKIFQEKMGMGIEMFDNLNLQTLLIQTGILTLDCPIDLGYDMLFLSEANRLNKEVVGLESAADQIQALYSMSDEEALKSLTYFANHYEEVKTETDKMVNLYKEKEVQKLYDFTVSTFDDPEFPQGNVEDLLDNRNIKWIPIIKTQIADKPTFIAVGAAHLAGENGVINLLRKEGYTVMPYQD